jgi:hypothetical protein
MQIAQVAVPESTVRQQATRTRRTVKSVRLASINQQKLRHHARAAKQANTTLQSRLSQKRLVLSVPRFIGVPRLKPSLNNVQAVNLPFWGNPTAQTAATSFDPPQTLF